LTKYVIDGHNVIGSGRIPNLSLDDEDKETRLVQWLRARQPRLRKPMMVVFDKGVPGGTSLALSGGGVTVRFAPPHSNADNVILTIVRNASAAKDIIVVTNDGALRSRVEGLGAQSMRVNVFLQRLASPAGKMPPREDAFKEHPELMKKDISEFLEMFGELDEEA